ncbi:MAG: Bac transf protein [Candidatus Magasanikbacteria bacterium]|nr:Bac transf protein [Candidatus Magasanikbacteria bacterium]
MEHSIVKIKQVLLLIVDYALMGGGLALTLLLRYGPDNFPKQWSVHVWPFGLVFFVWLIIFFINGLYDLRLARNNVNFFRRFSEALIISALLSVGFFYLAPGVLIAPKTNLLISLGIFTFLFVLWRINFNALVARAVLKTRLLFIGRTPEVDELIQLFENMPQLGYEVTAIVDPEKKSPEGMMGKISIYHSLTTIRPAVNEHDAALVVLSPHIAGAFELQRELYELLFWKVGMMDLTSFYELITGRVPTSAFTESWFLENLQESRKRFYDLIRIIVDYALALALGALTFALLLPIAAAIRLESPGPILFKQKRVGRLGKIFTIYKFRSMRALSADGSAEIGAAQFAESRDERVTRVGRVLRALRLDELPQVWNILGGEMSFIGPRPERPEFVDQVKTSIPFFNVRHLVKPGMTGWAQINFTYTSTLEQLMTKLQYDVYYIKHRSFMLDAAILLKTVAVVVRKMGR